MSKSLVLSSRLLRRRLWDLTPRAVIGKVEQDLVCCVSYDDTTNTCTQTAIPATKTVTVSLKQADVDQEFKEEGDLLFKGCTVKVVPNPDMPAEAKDPALLEEMGNYIYCDGTDIPAKSSGTVEVTYSQGLLKEVILPLWYNLGNQLLAYTIEATVKYAEGDREYTKVIKIPIDFDNFIQTENDMCQQ